MQSKFQRGQWVYLKSDPDTKMWVDGHGVKFNRLFENKRTDLKNYHCKWEISGREHFSNYNEEDLELVQPQPRNKFEQEKPADDLKVD